MLRTSWTRALVAGTLTVAALIGASSLALADSGGLETTYGSNGSRSIATPSGTSVFTDSIKLADGSVVAVGATGAAGARDSLVAKFTAAGALDATFGTGGVMTFDAAGTNETAQSLSVRAGGGFVIGGADSPDNSGANGYIAKITAAGMLDASWNTTGFQTYINLINVGGVAEIANGDVMFTSVDGSVEIDAGQATPAGGLAWVDQRPTVASGVAVTVESVGLYKRADNTYMGIATGTRADGSTDISTVVFNEATGVVIEDVIDSNSFVAGTSGLSLVSAVATTGSALLLTGSAATGGSSPFTGAIVKLLPNGTLDATYGSGGMLKLPTATLAWSARSAAVTADGSTWVVGNVGTATVRSLRLTPAGAVDQTYGDANGIADRMFGQTSARANAMTLDAQERPVVAGAFGANAATYRIERYDYATTNLLPITSSPALVQRLKTTTFTFSMTNTGPDATDVMVDIDVPKSFENPTYTSTAGGTTTPVADGSGVTWTLAQLPAGATTTLTLVGKPGDTGTLTVASTITSQSAQRVGAAAAPQTLSVTVFGAATPRDDVIVGTPGPDRIDALQGNDRVDGLGGNDVLFGNLGNDWLFGNSGNDVVSGGPGRDRVMGGTGNDKLFGNDGNDRLYGGPGIDTLHGGPGVDYLQGDTGDDYLIGLYGNDLLIGGPGKDRLDGDGGNDKLYGNSGNDLINGKSGNDIAFGDEGNDWLRGFEGNDTLYGGSGRDLLNGGAGKDKLYGGVGFDIIRADDGFGGDVINCGTGFDLVYANYGDQVSSNCEFVKYDVPAGTPRTKG